ncbi:MAG: phosphonate ABC transporter, permease protein PhnE [Methylococcus sp.]|nr:phosphonate ABC transporter, permease protein PhnE [Methylococcus sp.]
MSAFPASEMAVVFAHARRRGFQQALGLSLAMFVAALAFGYAGALEANRYVDAWATLATLLGDAFPPDFGRWRSWAGPILDTLAMSVVGTLLGSLIALPLGALAACGVGPRWMRGAVLMLLNTLRSIPGLVWGILFVAAVGFGPLPGIFALACHSAGVIGKLFAEILEHVDPAPGAALSSHGVSALGILRFSVWPQVMPRLVDAVLYRWDHNLRAAMTLGLVGAGGLGLAIATAFHLFEYREALALIIVLFGLVTGVNFAGSRIRARLLGTR